MKGVSPLIATVLLIAFTVAVAGIVSLWVSNFTKTTTTFVQNQSQQRVNCAYGGIAIFDVNYCGTRSELSGKITNNNIVTLGSITLQEIYTNGSSPMQPFCMIGSSVANCTAANLTIPPGYLYTFNISGISGGFSTVNLITNCPGVTDNTKTWTSNC